MCARHLFDSGGTTTTRTTLLGRCSTWKHPVDSSHGAASSSARMHVASATATIALVIGPRCTQFITREMSVATNPSPATNKNSFRRDQRDWSFRRSIRSSREFAGYTDTVYGYGKKEIWRMDYRGLMPWKCHSAEESRFFSIKEYCNIPSYSPSSSP